MRAITLTVVVAAALLTVPRALDQPVPGLVWAAALVVAIVASCSGRSSVLRAAAPVAGVLWLQVVAFPLPTGVWVLGLVLGLLGALVALGMALIYRANRVLNFAQAELGTAPTVLVVGLVAFGGLPWLVAVPLGLAVAIILGVVVEVAIIRRFSRSPRLVLTVATIGLSQLMTVASILLPRLWGQTLLTEDIDVPFTARVTVDPLRFTGDHLLAVVLVPVVVAALAAFIRFTSVGVAVRAASERADRAALLGIPVRRLQTVVWCLATVLSFLGVLLRAGILGLPVASTLSIAALLSALAALVLGDLTDLVAVGASAVSLGVLEQGVIWNNPEDPFRVAPVLGGVILVGIFLRRPGRARAALDATVSWQASAEVRPIPAVLRGLPEVRLARLLGVAAAVGLLLFISIGRSPSDQVDTAIVGCFVLVAASIVVLTGWAGQISLGQMSFVAAGAVVGALGASSWRIDLSLSLLAAGAVGAVLALVIGLPALRLRGPFLAVTTLAFAVASTQFLLNRSQFTWLPNERFDRPRLFALLDLTSQRSMMWVVWAVTALGLLALRGIRHSRTGRAIVALRDNEQAVTSFGISVVRAKLTAFALSGFMAAAAGCLYSTILLTYSEQPYEPVVSFNIFTAAVVGGLGSLAGAVFGAVFLVGGQRLLPSDWQLLPSALGVLFVLLVLPGGLGGYLHRRRDLALRRVAERRRIVVPSLVADVRTDEVADVRTDEVAAELAPLGASADRRAERLRERRAGRQELLVVRDLDVRYGDVRILFGVNIEVSEGEVVALLGTNGAGKSTLLNAISGVVPASRGAVIFDGRDITRAPPEEIAVLGIGQVPGGRGTFPGLTVTENLRVAGWTMRRDTSTLDARLARVHEMFPVLVERRDDPAADLSGGQQQMLALSMAFLTRPKLLMIDELSLGLAPVVVEQLLDLMRAFKAEGTTILLVEQSVNVALTVADRAYFLEKGEVRFDGPTAELLERPDVLRSVFLEGATKGLAVPEGTAAAGPVDESTDGDGVLDEDAVLRRAAAHATAVPTNGRGPAPDGQGSTTPLEARGLSVRFGGVTAVDGVDLTVAPGEVVGVIGPNGAGKTTLFDLLTGHTRADEGTVAIGGVDMSSRSAAVRARAGLGRSFQDSRLFPSLTVTEAIAVSFDRWVEVRDPLNAAFRTPAVVSSEAAVDAEVDRLVDLLGLDAFRSKFVSELSTGSRRIVDLACVLAHRPHVVLLDEPSSGIAQREAEALGPLLLRIRDALGASLVVIEHDMGLVTSVSDRLVALDQGRLVTEGRPDEVLAHPDVVASYLGTGSVATARSGVTP